MSISPPPPLSAADYAAIESAVMETARGRWFLAEFARRNRHADTDMLLTAMARLEKAVCGDGLAAADRLRAGLTDMAEAIARAKSDIAALEPEGGIGEATVELDSVVEATERATSDILGAAEQIQELAWTLREQGLDSDHCDRLDARATDIYTACSFQDLTGQRTRKVIQAMRYLEGRLAAMIDLWGRTEDAAPSRPQSQAKPDDGLGQSDVDRMLHDELLAAPALQPAAEPEEEQPADAEPPAASPGLLAALSAEEKIALFT